MDRYTHWNTHWQTQTDFIICPMLYAIAMGQIILNKSASMPQRQRVCLCHYELTGLVMTLTFDLWPSKPFQQCPLIRWNNCGKLHWNPSAKYRDISSREAGVNGRTTDSRRTREHSASAAYCWRSHKTTSLTRCMQKLWEHATVKCVLIEQVRFKVFLEDQDGRCVDHRRLKVVPDTTCHNADDMITDHLVWHSSLGIYLYLV